MDLSIFLRKKYQVANSLKVYAKEVERQSDNNVKIIRSDRCGEYYGNCNEPEPCLSLFAKFLENSEVGGSVEWQSMEINEVRVNMSLPDNVPTSAPITNVVPLVEEHFNNVKQYLGETVQEVTNLQVSDGNCEPQIMS